MQPGIDDKNINKMGGRIRILPGDFLSPNDGFLLYKIVSVRVTSNSAKPADLAPPIYIPNKNKIKVSLFWWTLHFPSESRELVFHFLRPHLCYMSFFCHIKKFDSCKVYQNGLVIVN